jgi:hypothetical protein
MDDLPEGSVSSPALVRHNAVRHGLRTYAIVIPGVEDQDDWQQFAIEVVESLNPASAIENALAERAAELLWRLRRASRAERDIAVAQGQRDNFEAARRREELERNVREYGDRGPYKRELATPDPPAPPRVLPNLDELTIISKYEARLSRQLLNTLHELEALQERRAGRAAPLARLDVNLDTE